MRRAIVEGQVRDGVSVGSALALLYRPLLFGEDVPTVRDISPTIDLALDCIFIPIGD